MSPEDVPNVHTGFALLCLVLAIMTAPAGAAAPMTASQVAQALGFDRDAGQKLLAGEIVTAKREAIGAQLGRG
jgi:hypothetical protein